MEEQDETPKNETATDNITTSDKLEMLRLYQEDFLFRHTLYWNLFYKTIGAILGLLSLPFALYGVIKDFPWGLALFPFAAAFVSLYSLLLMQTEAVRMTTSRNRMNKMGKKLRFLYKKLEHKKDKGFKAKHPFCKCLLDCPVSEKMNLLYGVFFLAGLAEGLLIGFECFFIRRI